MNSDNRETKDLELGTSENTKEVTIEQRQPEFKTQENTAVKKEPSTSSAKGSILIAVLLSALFIGGGIPAGMAAAGYWKGYHGNSAADIINGNDDKSKQLQNEITNQTNNAIIWAFDQMNRVGYINDNTYKKTVSQAKSDADDAISSEKNDIQTQYGKTWEEQWTKHLYDLGFNNDDEYRNSKISSAYKAKITSQYTDESNVIGETTTTDDSTVSSYKYVSHGSVKTSSGTRYKYIKNTVPNTDVDASTFPTPEDVVSLYLKYVNPVTFNETVIPFTTTVSLSTKVNFTFDDTALKTVSDFYFSTNGDGSTTWTFKPKTTYYNGIIHPKSLSLAPEVDSSIYTYLFTGADQTLTVDQLDTVISSSAEAAGHKDEMNHVIVGNWTTNDKEEFGRAFSNGWTDDSGTYHEGIADLINDPTTGYRYQAIQLDIDGTDYIMTMSSDGLDIIGINGGTWDDLKGSGDLGKQLLIDQLDVRNKTINKDEGIDYRDLDNTEIFSDYQTWVNTNFNKLVLNQYMLAVQAGNVLDNEGNVKDVDSSWIDADLVSKFYGDIDQQAITSAISKEKEKDTLINTNSSIYDLQAWNNSASGSATQADIYLRDMKELFRIDEFNKGQTTPVDILVDVKDKSSLTYKGGAK